MPEVTFGKIDDRHVMYVEAIPVYVSEEDIDDIGRFKWSVTSNGYVVGWVPGLKMVSLHRYLMGCPKGKVVDHKDHNRLNNERSNLEIVTSAENNRNSKPRLDHKQNKLPLYVYWNKQKELYHAQYKGIHIGYFPTLEEAIERVEFCKNSIKNN